MSLKSASWAILERNLSDQIVNSRILIENLETTSAHDFGELELYWTNQILKSFEKYQFLIGEKKIQKTQAKSIIEQKW